MSKEFWIKLCQREDGQSAVEYALLLWVVLILVLTHDTIIGLLTSYFYRISGVVSSPFP